MSSKGDQIMTATTQIVAEAIRSSKQQNKIEHIRSGGGISRGMLSAIHDEMPVECEGNADSDGETEYWGVDVDGNTWRVHVETP